MLSKRADAFEDVAMDQDERRRVRLEQARSLLDAQADALMKTDSPTETHLEAHHATYNPHRRPLSSAARRLIRAHLITERAAEE